MMLPWSSFLAIKHSQLKFVAVVCYWPSLAKNHKTFFAIGTEQQSLLLVLNQTFYEVTGGFFQYSKKQEKWHRFRTTSLFKNQNDQKKGKKNSGIRSTTGQRIFTPQPGPSRHPSPLFAIRRPPAPGETHPVQCWGSRGWCIHPAPPCHRPAEARRQGSRRLPLKQTNQLVGLRLSTLQLAASNHQPGDATNRGANHCEK